MIYDCMKESARLKYVHLLLPKRTLSRGGKDQMSENILCRLIAYARTFINLSTLSPSTRGAINCAAKYINISISSILDVASL